MLHCSSFFFFNDTATTEIYTLSLHDALPIWQGRPSSIIAMTPARWPCARLRRLTMRSEEHTSELQSRENLVCRLMLEKKKYLYTPKVFAFVEGDALPTRRRSKLVQHHYNSHY